LQWLRILWYTTDSGLLRETSKDAKDDIDINLAHTMHVMKLLLNRPDVDPNFAGGSDGATPLILGADFPDVVKLLLDQQGIDVNSQENSAPLSLKSRVTTT
jgi:hypothetical protein